MIIDTSAMIAILYNEPECQHFIDQISQHGDADISAANYLETRIVLLRAGKSDLAERLHYLLELLLIDIIEVDAEQAELAADAYQRYGKGFHPAALNFGDCFAYALAKYHSEVPILCKGNDFAQTDIRVVA